MRFSIATSVTALAAISAMGVAAAPAADRAQESELVTRQLDPISLAIISGVASTVATWAATEGLNAIKSKVNSISGNWDRKREAFTQATTTQMATKNPNSAKYKAAVCYNQNYSVSNKQKISSTGLDTDIGKVADVNLKSGALNTDYDCFYMMAGSTFTVGGDGGFINLSMNFKSSDCTYDKNAGVLTCK